MNKVHFPCACCEGVWGVSR